MLRTNLWYNVVNHIEKKLVTIKKLVTVNYSNKNLRVIAMCENVTNVI